MTTPLITLLEHAENQRNEALALLLQAEEAARRLQQQALQLTAYRDDYRLRQPAQVGRAVTVDLLRSHHEFMHRLEAALTQQQGQIQAADGRVAARRAELLALETRVASVRKLLERRSHDERRRTARQEQRHSDDAAPPRRRADGGHAPGWSTSTEAVPLSH